MPCLDLEAELNETVRIVRLSAGSLEECWKTAKYRIQEKNSDDFVTSIDLEISDYLRSRLPQAKKRIWLSEENSIPSDLTFQKDTWIVDPIDGTRELIQGIPEFAVSVALARSSRLILAVIYNPITDECFYASENGGAWLNGQRILVIRPGKKETKKWLVSRTDSKNGAFASLSHRNELLVMGSIAYKLALVAAGKSHGTISVTPKNLWDYAAGALLVKEADGMTTDLMGNDLTRELRCSPVAGLMARHSSLDFYEN